MVRKKVQLKKVKVTAIRCRICRDIIYSRARHDFRKCSCGAVSIDGGFDYTHIGYERQPVPKAFVMWVQTTKEKLYDDWNNRIDLYGRLKWNEYL